MLELMLRSVIVGAFATAAALLFERGLTHLRVGTRFAWTFALHVTLLLPFLPQLTTTRVPGVVPVIAAPEIVVVATSNIESRFAVNPGMAVWLLLSLIAVGAYLVAYVQLLRACRTWTPARLAQQDVYMSERFGPAVFGFLRPRIVVPRWVSDTASEEQELIVLHEREHIRAHDQLQLLLAIAATVVMPWNPFVWMQSRRLRFTVETDCDQRVLAAAPDPGRYASLLVNVGSKQRGLLLTPALAEHRNGLERRLRMLATKLIQNRWKAAGLMVAGVVLTVVACESRLPQETTDASSEVVLDERPAVEVETRPTTESRELAPTRAGGEPLREVPRVMIDRLSPTPKRSTILDEEYPPLLRNAGIGGTVSLRLHVTNGGEADRVEVAESSGHEALDQAAVRAVKRMAWGHGGPGKTTDYWTTTSLTFSNNAQGLKMRMPQRDPVREDGVSLPRKVDPDGEPHFTPYTTRPSVSNRDEVQRLLIQSYPPALRDAGVGGTVVAWVLVDARGNVMSTRLKQTSGHPALDAAGLKAAEHMKFTPADHNGMPVNVWIQLPVSFRVQ